MLASLADAPLADPELVYEPKYDGSGRSSKSTPGGRVSLWSRLGNEKTHQFPEIATALEAWARRRKAPRHESCSTGRSSRSMRKANRPDSSSSRDVFTLPSRRRLPSFPLFPPVRPFQPFPPLQPAAPPWPLSPSTFCARGAPTCATAPCSSAASILERVFPGGRISANSAQTVPPVLRISEITRADGRALYRARARQRLGRADCETGRLRVSIRQADAGLAEAQDRPRTGIRHRRLDRAAPHAHVLRGAAARAYTRTITAETARATESSADSARSAFVPLGVHRPHGNRLQRARARAADEAPEAARDNECPFRERPQTNERPHWVQPKLVAQIKFTEWTADGKLRHPVYLGLRDDKKPEESCGNRRQATFW